jgi:dihydrofolate reductase
MRKVILFMHISLDGFTAGPNGEMDWVSADEEAWKDVIDLQSTVDAALFGRVNYQDFESYWPSAATDPSSTQNDIDYAHWIEDIPKIVFSKTMEKVEWKNTRLVKEHIAEEIAKMKQQPGKNLLLFGGASIAQTFMKLGLIDEYRLNVNPVVLGSGQPLFNDIKDRINLKLMNAKTYHSGVVLLHYSPHKKET